MITENFSLANASFHNTQTPKSEVNLNYLNKVPINNYIIGTGDILNIIVSREYPELTIDSAVDIDGAIWLPRLYKVYIKGLTINELQDLLNKAYKKFVRYPQVEINIKKYRPVRFYIEGEVLDPGYKIIKGSFFIDEADLKDNKNIKDNKNDSILNQLNSKTYFPTLFSAIRASGGITEYSDIKNVEILRKDSLTNGSGVLKSKVNIEEIFENNDFQKNIRIFDGDIIKIKRNKEPNLLFLKKAYKTDLNPKYIKVMVTGRIKNPNTYEIPNQSVLNDVIDAAGGTKILKGPITLIRFNNDGTLDRRKFSYSRRAKRGSYKNPVLREKDFVVVGHGNLSNMTEVINEITAPFTGIFSTYGLLKVVTE